MTRKIWPSSASSTVSACGQADRRREVAEAQRRQRHEAEVEVFGLGVWPLLDEERRLPEVADREVDEGKQEPYEHIRAEGAEHGLVGDTPMGEHTSERDRQRRRHEQHHRQEIGQRHDRLRVDEEDDRRQRDAGGHEIQCRRRSLWPEAGSLIATMSASADRSVLPIAPQRGSSTSSSRKKFASRSTSRLA